MRGHTTFPTNSCGCCSSSRSIAPAPRLSSHMAALAAGSSATRSTAAQPRRAQLRPVRRRQHLAAPTARSGTWTARRATRSTLQRIATSQRRGARTRCCCTWTTTWCRARRCCRRSLSPDLARSRLISHEVAGADLAWCPRVAGAHRRRRQRAGLPSDPAPRLVRAERLRPRVRRGGLRARRRRRRERGRRGAHQPRGHIQGARLPPWHRTLGSPAPAPGLAWTRRKAEPARRRHGPPLAAYALGVGTVLRSPPLGAQPALP